MHRHQHGVDASRKRVRRQDHLPSPLSSIAACPTAKGRVEPQRTDHCSPAIDPRVFGVSTGGTLEPDRQAYRTSDCRHSPKLRSVASPGDRRRVRRRRVRVVV
jgi:hypothetical protein